MYYLLNEYGNVHYKVMQEDFNQFTYIFTNKSLVKNESVVKILTEYLWEYFRKRF